MPVVMVTGMSGTGKSTALAELARRGHRVVDTDYGGFSEEVPPSDGREREQLWREDRIDALLDEHVGGVLFISGCVANQGKFYPRFDAVVLLSAPLGVILERLAVRKTNEFGKTDAERDRIVRDLTTFEQLLRTTSTAEIDLRRRSTRSSMSSSASQTRSPADSRPTRSEASRCDNRTTQTGEDPMATKADFTEDEWEAMSKGVTGAGMLVSIGDRDFTDSFGEVGALAKRLSEERKESGSELMRELAAGRPKGFGLTASPEEVESKTLEALRSATATLAAKAPDEVGAYRQLVLDVAESVAGAKGGVKPGETGAIDKIKEALGPA